MKLAIYGYSGSGKSTLAKYLGSCCGAPVLHLDAETAESMDGRCRSGREYGQVIRMGLCQ